MKTCETFLIFKSLSSGLEVWAYRLQVSVSSVSSESLAHHGFFKNGNGHSWSESLRFPSAMFRFHLAKSDVEAAPDLADRR